MNPSLKSLHIYPLKSGAARNVDDAVMTERGLGGDRRWMVVRGEADDNGVHRFITQRDRGMAVLSQVRAIPYDAPDGARVRFDFPDDNSLLVSMDAAREKCLVKIWDDVVQAREHTDLANRMFSAFLGQDCRLVTFDDDVRRAVDYQYAGEWDHTAFADGFPLLVTNQASLDALNAEMAPEERVEMSRFRPNIVLEGLAPFEEDNILSLQIGDVELFLAKPCSRCVLTTIDQETGEKPSKEPMQSLARLRRGMDKNSGLKGVFFGQNAIPRKLGTIKKGDEVTILKRKAPHPALQSAKLKF